MIRLMLFLLVVFFHSEKGQLASKHVSLHQCMGHEQSQGVSDGFERSCPVQWREWHRAADQVAQNKRRKTCGRVGDVFMLSCFSWVNKNRWMGADVPS